MRQLCRDPQYSLETPQQFCSKYTSTFPAKCPCDPVQSDSIVYERGPLIESPIVHSEIAVEFFEDYGRQNLRKPSLVLVFEPSNAKINNLSAP